MSHKEGICQTWVLLLHSTAIFTLCTSVWNTAFTIYFSPLYTFTLNCALQCGTLLLYFVVPLWTLQLPVWSVSRLQAGSLDNHSLIPGKSHWTSIIVLIFIFACVHWLNFLSAGIAYSSKLICCLLTKVHYWKRPDVGLGCFPFLNFLSAAQIECKQKICSVYNNVF